MIENKAKHRIVIKIGSNVITRQDGKLDITRMASLVDQVVELKKNGLQIILVSSGAVAAGKQEIRSNPKLDMVSSRQLFSAVGQMKLLNIYYSLFHQQETNCGQVLATKDDFSTRIHYLNQRNCMNVMLDNGIVPIVNENDAVSVDELMFTDNDELSGLVAAMMDCSSLIILSNVDGVFNGDPNHESAQIIREVKSEDRLEDFIQKNKSSMGRGGMITKYHIARKVSEEGIEVIIANGKKDSILIDIISGNTKQFTRFIPSENKISNIKRWVAHSKSFAKGEIHINSGAQEALYQSKATSLLPVGVVQIEGIFEVDDIVKIMNPEGIQIGVGKSSYSSSQAKNLMGKKQEKPIVHYNYLYIERK